MRVRSLASLSGLRIWHCCEMWCRLAAVAPTRPLAWEPPYATGAAKEIAKRQKKKKQKRDLTIVLLHTFYWLPMSLNKIQVAN